MTLARMAPTGAASGDVAVLRRFSAKVTPEPNSGCWLWTACTNGDGYGLFGNGAGKVVLAHRWAYEFYVDAIPAGLVLDHRCRNRSCVNPSHLEPVANRVNILRGVGITAAEARRTHCVHGHELTGDNLYQHPSGARVCRECSRAQKRKSYAKASLREVSP